MPKKFTTHTLFAPGFIRNVPRTAIPSSNIATPHILGFLITAVDCTRAAVQTAIDSVADGGTVIVPAGSCTWDAAVTITNKTITLQGAGSGSGGTKITHGGGDYSLINIGSGVGTGNMDISGFWFAGSSENWNGTALWLGGPPGGGLRIHHNVFDGNYPWSIGAYTGNNGVIDHNTFKGSAHGIRFFGDGASDWSSPLTLGTAGFFFVEDNIFDWDDWYGTIGPACMDMNSGGRVVFRNNTVTYGFFETHDKARSTLVSANAYEVYNNTFSSGSTEKWKAIDITAGTGVIWGNSITGTYTAPIGVMDYKSFDPRNVLLCDGTDPADQNVPGEAGWRCQYQAGTQGEGATAISYPIYLWNNTYNDDPVDMVCTAGCVVDGRPHLLDGRDFINNGTTPKPGYTPYTYPHPRTAF